MFVSFRFDIQDRCLKKNEMCPVGYYYEWVGPQEQGPLKPLAGKSICRKCHPRCKQCTAYGFHEQVRSLSSNDHQQSFKNSYETPRIRKNKIL